MENNSTPTTSKNKMNTQIWIVSAIIIIAVIILLLYRSSQNSNLTQTNTSSTTHSTTTPTTTTSNTSNSVVMTKNNANVGNYLADTSGKTLYTYGSDTPGKSNCSGSCASAWPPYLATNAPATLPANITVITRSDGSKQYAYKEMPLYYFASDSTPGQVTGDGVSGFNVAK